MYSCLRQADSSVCVYYVEAIIAAHTRALHSDWPSSTKDHAFPIDLCYHWIETALPSTFLKFICFEQHYTNFVETLSIDILITNYELFILQAFYIVNSFYIFNSFLIYTINIIPIFECSNIRNIRLSKQNLEANALIYIHFVCARMHACMRAYIINI